MMELAPSHDDVKMWLISMLGKMIDVMILQTSVADRVEQILWKGKGKVLRCVQEGVVLDLNAGGASWWSRLWGAWHVAPRWIRKPLSVPYRDLSIDVDPATGTTQLVIDADTWERSAEELTMKTSPEENERL